MMPFLLLLLSIISVVLHENCAQNVTRSRAGAISFPSSLGLQQQVSRYHTSSENVGSELGTFCSLNRNAPSHICARHRVT